MAVCDEIRIKPFWDFSEVIATSPRINGGIHHHCDICPKKVDESCTLTCQIIRQEIEDGVTVT